MDNEKYFVLVSIVAFVSLGYIAYDKIPGLNFAYNNEQYATVMTALSTSTATSTRAMTTAKKFILPPESPTNYTDNKNGTITDNYTGLIWKKCPQGMVGNDCKSGSPSQRAWSKARVECEDLDFAGKKGWRLPNLKELQSIVDSGAFNPSINKNFFYGTNDPYWTLTSPAEHPGSKFTVIFSEGNVYYNDVNNSAATRCVYVGSLK